MELKIDYILSSLCTAFLRQSENPVAMDTAAPSAAPTAPSQPSILGKRGFDQSAGSEPAPKRQNIGVIRQAGNAKQVIAHGSRSGLSPLDGLCLPQVAHSIKLSHTK